MPPSEEEAVGHEQLPRRGEDEGGPPASKGPEGEEEQGGDDDEEEGAGDDAHFGVMAQLYFHVYVFLRQR